MPHIICIALWKFRTRETSSKICYTLLPWFYLKNQNFTSNENVFASCSFNLFITSQSNSKFYVEWNIFNQKSPEIASCSSCCSGHGKWHGIDLVVTGTTQIARFESFLTRSHKSKRSLTSTSTDAICNVLFQMFVCFQDVKNMFPLEIV